MVMKSYRVQINHSWILFAMQSISHPFIRFLRPHLRLSSAMLLAYLVFAWFFNLSRERPAGQVMT